MSASIRAYQSLDDDDIEQLAKDIAQAYSAAAAGAPIAAAEAEDEIVAPQEPVEITSIPDLIGIEESVFRQINAALQSDKRHLMFFGPPGTGKTTLARHVAQRLANRYTLITGSSDWSSQDIVGGYQPIGDGKIGFVKGVLLRNFDRPLVIDELNRCDIDKVIGPLFTVLSGQPTTLPYRVNVQDAESELYSVFPKPNPSAKPNVEFAPGPAWRIIATINSIDKASLYQMSYALMRRFAWILVDVPRDLNAFIDQFLDREKINRSLTATYPLTSIWSAVNRVRTIGPAPIIDAIRTLHIMDPSLDLGANPTEAQATLYVEAFDMFFLPLLDGIFRERAAELGAELATTLGIGNASPLLERLKQRLEMAAV